MRCQPGIMDKTYLKDFDVSLDDGSGLGEIVGDVYHI